MVYSTKPAMSKLDHFVHVITCRAENFKVLIACFEESENLCAISNIQRFFYPSYRLLWRRV